MKIILEIDERMATKITMDPHMSFFMIFGVLTEAIKMVECDFAFRRAKYLLAEESKEEPHHEG